MDIIELLSKFENGKELYMTNAMFKAAIESIARGSDPIGILIKVIESNIELTQELYKCINNRGVANLLTTSKEGKE